ncbi:MAG: type II toxin-antitoxin system RelE/ParE family toxin [Pseudomonadales bacterium]
MKVSYSRESIEDLIRLREFIENKNPVVAQGVASELLSGVDKLRVLPKMGLPVGSAPSPESIRDIYVLSYTVRYLITDPNITILRIWHNKISQKDT